VAMLRLQEHVRLRCVTSAEALGILSHRRSVRLLYEEMSTFGECSKRRPGKTLQGIKLFLPLPQEKGPRHASLA